MPGETVVLHVINGGLEIHEAVFGDIDDQLAWEAAEEATVGAPPGPDAVRRRPEGFDGVRVVVGSGQRVDVAWTVPADAASAAGGWFVGCHIPGHWQKGMVVPVRFVGPDGVPLGTAPPLPSIGARRLTREPRGRAVGRGGSCPAVTERGRARWYRSAVRGEPARGPRPRTLRESFGTWRT